MAENSVVGIYKKLREAEAAVMSLATVGCRWRISRSSPKTSKTSSGFTGMSRRRTLRGAPQPQALGREESSACCSG